MQHKSRECRGYFALENEGYSLDYMICGSVPSSVPKFIYEFRGSKKTSALLPHTSFQSVRVKAKTFEPHDDSAADRVKLDGAADVW